MMPSMMMQSPSDESDCSDSNSSNSSDSSSSSGNSGQDINELFETAKILSERLNLPKDLCENRAIFDEFFSLDTWNELPENVRTHLKSNFLPNYPDNSDVEKDITLEQLFTGQIERFGQRPLDRFQYNLEEGNYRPDIAKLRAAIERSRRHEQRFQECERASRMAKMLVISREKLLRAVVDAPPGTSVRPERVQMGTTKLASSGAALRAKKRYFEEISAIAEEVGLPSTFSDDENYPEGPPPQLSKKQKRHLAGIQMGATSPGAERRVYCTLNPKGSSLDHLVGPGGTTPLSDDVYRQMLHRHKKRKLEDYDHPEMDTSDIQLKEVFERTKFLATVGRKPLHYGKVHSAEGTKKPPSSTIVKPNASTNRFQEQLNRSQSLLMLGHQTSTSDAPVVKVEKQPELLTVATKSNLTFTSDTDEDEFEDLLEEDVQQQLEQQYAQKYGFEEDEDYDDEINRFSSSPLLSVKNNLGKKITGLAGNKAKNKMLVGNNVATLGSGMAVANNKLIKQENLGHDPTGVYERTNNNRMGKPVTATNNSFDIAYANKVKVATLSDLEGIDMMHLPVDLDDGGNMDMLDDLTPTSSRQDRKLMAGELLSQDKYLCFLSLIRDCFCATPDHRMPMDELRRKVSMEMSNPITALSNWYNHAENWLALLTSAINFLAGEFLDQPEDFVPYLEFKIHLNTYQWIGAGRDSDNHLLPLYQFWLARRHEMSVRPTSSGSSSTTPSSKLKHENKHYNKQHHQNNVYNSNSSLTDEDYGQTERMASPPPPRCTTTWTVRKSSNEEIREFRRQEKRRYENPHMAYTYRQHGYESVVGPVKGIYTQVPGISKARDHNMLVPERPNYVTILTLVRDATARLPNGEGTRVEICELLKSSQYISQTAHDQLQTIVSGALDRMHTEHDPCVRYDGKKKIWIYLHRNRSEEEFEKLHHQFQGLAKPKTPKLRMKGPNPMVSPPPPHQHSLIPGKLLQTPPKLKMNSSSNSSSPSTPSPTPQQQQQALPTVSANKLVNQSSKSLIKMRGGENAMEYIDVEASLDIHTTPIIVNQQNEGGDPNIARTASPSLNKVNVVTPPGAMINRMKKLSTQQSVVRSPNMTSILVNQQGQRAQSPIVTKAGPLLTTGNLKKTVARSLIVNTSTAHQLPATTAVTTTKIIPTSTNQIKVVPQPLKTGQPTINAKPTMLQNKQFIRVASASPAGKVPTTLPVNVSNTGSATVQIKSSPTPGSRTNIISTITIPKGQQAFTSAQQKQILQTIMASQQQQQKQTQQQPKTGLPTSQANQAGSPRVIFTQQVNYASQPTSVTTTTTSGAPQQQQHLIQQKLTNAAPTFVAATGTSSTMTISGTNTVTTSGSSQIVQIQPQGKVHTMTATNLTPQQQQQLLQTIKQQQVKNQASNSQTHQNQQPLIVNKPFIQFQRNNTTTTKTTPILTGSPLLNKPTTGQVSMHQVQTSVANSGAIATTARLVKPGTSLIQSAQQNQSNHIIVSSANTAIKTGTATMTKMLTNSGGQVISLDTLLQQQKGMVPGTTLRVAGSKAGQTQLIQIAANSTRPTQFTLGQGKNFVSVTPQQQQQRLLTTQAGTIVKNAELKSTNTGTVAVASTNPSNVIVSNNSQSVGGDQQQFKIIHASNQQHHIQQQQQQFVGVQNVIGGKMKTTGIRMVNASNLNIAHIGGKPVIIASKNSVGGMTQVTGNQNIVLQSGSTAGTNFVIGGQTVKLQGNLLSTANLNLINQQQSNQSQTQQQQPQAQQTVMLGNQLVKVQTINQLQQQSQQTVRQQQTRDGIGNLSTGTVLLGNTGQTIKVHNPQVSLANSGQQVLIGNQIKNSVKTTTTIQQQPQQQQSQPQQRVMLATQGQGGQLVTQQILLPPGFQGGSINIKTLQGLKVIPINQQGKAAGANSYARILSTTPQQPPKPSTNSPNTTQNTSNE